MSHEKQLSKGYVYVAGVNGDNSKSKIGFTRQKPKERISQLKRDYIDCDFYLKGFFESDTPGKLEYQVHEFLKSRLIERELFSVTPSSAIRCIKLIGSRRFAVVDEENILGFSCVSLPIYEFCKVDREKAIRRMNRFLFKMNIRLVGDLFSRRIECDFEKYVTNGGVLKCL